MTTNTSHEVVKPAQQLKKNLNEKFGQASARLMSEKLKAT